MSELVIVAMIGALAGCLTAIVTVLATRRKNDADANKAVSEAVENLLPPMSKRIDELAVELLRVRRGVGLLIGQIRTLGYEPVWTLETADQPIDRRIGRK